MSRIQAACQGIRRVPSGGIGECRTSKLNSRFTRSKGKEVMESFIKAENNGKNICAVYAHNDDMAIGAIQAIKEAGLKPGTDIKIISIDGVPDIFKAMMAGEANASVELTPNMAGPAFDALLAYKKDGTQPPKLIKTESILFEPESAQAQLELKKDMGY
ncbi:substrate-binding domain-containing protein [Aeromonas media]|uniref:substrate-binding domain-containing protein n=1 Tax=Aeromonas media TaxID=651 RepID=UPI0009DE35C4|nr:substrate-binding domain-containing protein [Aeromonas media]